jgi:hypothetical protein
LKIPIYLSEKLLLTLYPNNYIITTIIKIKNDKYLIKRKKDMECKLDKKILDKLKEYGITRSLIKNLSKEELNKLLSYIFKNNIEINIGVMDKKISCKKNNDLVNKTGEKILATMGMVDTNSINNIMDEDFAQTLTFLTTILSSRYTSIKITPYFITDEQLKLFEELLLKHNLIEYYAPSNDVYNEFLSAYISELSNTTDENKLTVTIDKLAQSSKFISSPLKFILLNKNIKFATTLLEYMIKNNYHVETFVNNLDGMIDVLTDDELDFLINTFRNLKKDSFNKLLLSILISITIHTIHDMKFKKFNKLMINTYDMATENIINALYIPLLAELRYNPNKFKDYYNVADFLSLVEKRTQENYFEIVNKDNKEAVLTLLILGKIKLNKEQIMKLLRTIYDNFCDIVKEHFKEFKFDLSSVIIGHDCEDELGFGITSLFEI